MTMRSARLEKINRLISYMLLLAALPLLAVACGNSSGGSSDPSVEKVSDYSFPTDVTVSADGTRLYVANNVRNSVSIIDTASMDAIADIRVSCNPRHLAVDSADTKLYVSHDNVSGCRLSPLPQLDTDPTTGFSGTKVTFIDLTTNAATKELRLNGMKQDGKIRSLSSARQMFWDTSNSVLYVTGLDSSSVAMIDTDLVDTLATYQFIFTEEEAGEVKGYVRNITQPVDLDMTSDGATVVVPQYGGASLSLIDTTTLDEYGTAWSLSGCTNPSNPVIYKPSGDANADKYVFISCKGSDNVKIYDISDTAATTATDLGSIGVGDAPTVMHLSSDGKTLIVLNSGDGTVSTIPWETIKGGASQAYGLEFSVRSGSSDANSLLSDMAVYGTTVYVSDMLANTITTFNYADSFSSVKTITYQTDKSSKPNYFTIFTSFPY